MVRGYQRRIILLKNTGSDVFEEAYFVMSDRGVSAGLDTDEMICEANRIIEENLSREYTELESGFFRKCVGFLKKNILPFVVGAALASLVFILAILL